MDNHLTDEEIQSLSEGGKLNDRQLAHASACGECGQALREYKRLISALRKEPDLTLSPDFADRVLSRVGKKRFESWELLFLPLSGICGIVAIALSVDWIRFKAVFQSLANSMNRSMAGIVEPLRPFLGENLQWLYLLSALSAMAIVALIDRKIVKWKRHGILH